jgi:hypothetical protein
MIKKIRHKLTLHQPYTYQIKVPGELNPGKYEWVENISLVVEISADGLAVTTLTGSFDQASLQSLLRRLYSLGMPLISAICVDIVD